MAGVTTEALRSSTVGTDDASQASSTVPDLEVDLDRDAGHLIRRVRVEDDRREDGLHRAGFATGASSQPGDSSYWQTRRPDRQRCRSCRGGRGLCSTSDAVSSGRIRLVDRGISLRTCVAVDSSSQARLNDGDRGDVPQINVATFDELRIRLPLDVQRKIAAVLGGVSTS